MFDHVTLRTADLAATARAYRPMLAALGARPDPDTADRIAWQDFGFAPADAEHPVTRHVHVGLLAASSEAIAAFWQTGLAAGLPDDGAPGPRPGYGDGYEGGFLRDLDGNSIEACRHPNSTDGSLVDHVWLRVRDVAASQAFYAALAPWTGFALAHEEPGYARFRGPGASFSVVAGEPFSEHVHLAFPAAADGAVDAVRLDPDGHAVEIVGWTSPRA